MVVVAVAPDAGDLVGRGPRLGPQVVFVGAGVLVRVVVQRVGALRVALDAEFVRRASGPRGQRHGVETPGDRQGRAEDPRHQLVRRVAVDGRAGRVAVVLTSTIFWLDIERERERAEDIMFIAIGFWYIGR